MLTSGGFECLLIEQQLLPSVSAATREKSTSCERHQKELARVETYASCAKDGGLEKWGPGI